jgi:hypothetical protein
MLMLMLMWTNAIKLSYNYDEPLNMFFFLLVKLILAIGDFSLWFDLSMLQFEACNSSNFLHVQAY